MPNFMAIRRSVEKLVRYDDLRFFKMTTVHHLGF